MLATAFEVTFTTGGGIILSALVFAVSGFFTQKKLNPQYEDLIEQRMNRVGLSPITCKPTCDYRIKTGQ